MLKTIILKTLIAIIFTDVNKGNLDGNRSLQPIFFQAHSLWAIGAWSNSNMGPLTALFSLNDLFINEKSAGRWRLQADLQGQNENVTTEEGLDMIYIMTFDFWLWFRVFRISIFLLFISGSFPSIFTICRRICFDVAFSSECAA